MTCVRWTLGKRNRKKGSKHVQNITDASPLCFLGPFTWIDLLWSPVLPFGPFGVSPPTPGVHGCSHDQSVSRLAAASMPCTRVSLTGVRQALQPQQPVRLAASGLANAVLYAIMMPLQRLSHCDRAPRRQLNTYIYIYCNIYMHGPRCRASFTTSSAHANRLTRLSSHHTMSHAPPLPPSRPDQMSPASGGAPQPQESVVVPLKPDQQSDWHQVWNPLDLHETAAPAEDTKMLFVYFLWSFTSDKVLACAPLLILCGDPTQGSIVYWFLIGAIGVFAAVFTAFHLQTMHNSTPMTFFKATLYIEWLRESKVWRVLSLLMVGWFFAFVMFMNYLRSKKDPDAPEPKIAGINFIALPDDAPKFPAIPFFILLASFFKSVYDIITYDEIFDRSSPTSPSSASIFATLFSRPLCSSPTSRWSTTAICG